MTLAQSEMTPPSSPESQGLLRSMNIRVNKGTGTAGVSIPLFTIKGGENIDIPITLSYTCSGIKVQDVASWVGLGWNLSSGGKITRVIVDNDDLNGGYCRGSGVLANNFTSWWGVGNLLRERVDHCTSTSNCTGCVTFDGEPDLYYYEIPGKAGMFTIDQDGVAWPIPYSPIKIVLDNNLNFSIIDEKGIKYTLDLKESTTVTKYSDVKHNGVNNITKSHISTWHLTKIKNVTGNEVIFGYTPGSEINYSNYNYKKKSNGTIVDKSINFRSIPYYLNQISWMNGKLEFLSSNGRTDLVNAKRLNEIKIYSSNNYLKTINLDYSSFKSNRLQLLGVTESNGVDKLTISKFEYNTITNLPGRNSKDFDHWGFYNGKSNTSYFPPDGANRTSSLSHTKADVLTKVFNNMGGFVEYEYEENKVTTGTAVGGLRIKSIKKYDRTHACETTSYSYTNGYGVSLYSTDDYNDNWNKGEKFCYLHDDKNTSVYYSTVTETLSNGSKIVSNYTTLMDKNCHDEVSKYNISSNEKDSTRNDVPTIFPNSSRSWRRGLLKEEIHYSSTSAYEIIKRVQYNYSFGNQIMKQIKGYFVHENDMPLGGFISHLVTYDWLSEAICVDTLRTSGKYIPTSMTTYTYDPKYWIPVEEKITFEKGDIYRTRTTYPFNYSPISNISGIIDNNSLDAMLAAGMIAQPIEKIKIKNGAIIEGKLFLYKTIGQNVPILAKTKTLSLGIPIDTVDFKISSINSSKKFYHDARYVFVNNYDNYDDKLNLISYHKDNCQPQSVIYGYNSSLPIASISNAVVGTTNNQAFHTSFEDVVSAKTLNSAKTGNKVLNGSYVVSLSNFKAGKYVLSYWKTSTSNIKWEMVEIELDVPSTTSYTIGNSALYIDEIRVAPKNSVMTTYTYIPSVGKTSETDTNGTTIYYEYDSFGRLMKVYDNDKNKIKEYEYFIKTY